MKFTLATALAVSAASADLQDRPEAATYTYDHDHYGNVPTGDFNDQVWDFDEWKTIWEQPEYEERLHTEAELMIAMEAIREALVNLDMDIDELDYCIEHNDSDIESNDDDIHSNDDAIEENEDEIEDQFYYVRRLQK